MKKNEMEFLDKRGRKAVEKKFDEKEKRIRAYRKEVSRKAAIANKRLARLEKKGMTSSPAYQSWLDSGGQKFSIRGKNYNQVQAELAKINTYLESATSSIRGANRVVKEMIKNTGVKIEYDNLKDVQKQTKKFFEISSKIEQYFRTVEDRASSIGYQKIWQAVNKYIEEQRGGVLDSERSVDDIANSIVKAMKEWDKPEKFNIDDTDSDGVGYSMKGWQKLSKD